MNRQMIYVILIMTGLILFGYLNLNELFIISQAIDTGSDFYSRIMIKMMLYFLGTILFMFLLLYYVWKVKGQEIDDSPSEKPE